ncbi:unnamed protein product [Laminaria digitata]
MGPTTYWTRSEKLSHSRGLIYLARNALSLARAALSVARQGWHLAWRGFSPSLARSRIVVREHIMYMCWNGYRRGRPSKDFILMCFLPDDPRNIYFGVFPSWKERVSDRSSCCWSVHWFVGRSVGLLVGPFIGLMVWVGPLVCLFDLLVLFPSAVFAVAAICMHVILFGKDYIK